MKTLQETFEASKDRKELLKVLADGFAEMMQEKGWFKSCLNCCHWNSGKLGIPTANDAAFPPETCQLYKARPPAHIIVTGCESHEDSIPF